MITKETTRNLTLDVIRILAVMAVVMIHCSSKFVSTWDSGTIEFLVGNIADSLSRLGVPLFVMTSGALLLDERKQISLPDVFGKYIKNILLLILVWGMFYALIFQIIKPLRNDEAVSITQVILAVGQGHFHMWYLYMMAGLYLAVPVFKTFVRRENKTLVLFYIGIALITCFTAPLLKALSVLYSRFAALNVILDNMHMGVFAGYAAYYLTGWYIVHIGVENRKARMGIYLAGILSAMFIIVYTQVTKEYDLAYSELGLPVYLYSASVFLALNNIQIKNNGKAERVLAGLSKLTFGVYILHIYFLDKFQEHFPYTRLPLVYIAVSFLVVFSVSLAASCVLSKIPVVKRAVRM